MSDLTVTAVTESLQLALKDTERQRNEARESLALADAEVEERRTQVGQLKAELTTANARADAAEQRSPLGLSFERIEELKAAESEVAALRAELTELNGELTRMQKTRNDAIVMAERLRAKHEECNDCELIAALRAEVERLRAAKLDREERFVVKHAELVAAESSLAEARALLDRCTMVPHSLLDDIRKWQSANPESPRADADPLHPTGRCACGGEGSCEWCMSHCLHCGSGTPRAAAERACPWCNARLSGYPGGDTPASLRELGIGEVPFGVPGP